MSSTATSHKGEHSSDPSVQQGHQVQIYRAFWSDGHQITVYDRRVEGGVSIHQEIKCWSAYSESSNKSSKACVMNIKDGTQNAYNTLLTEVS